MKRYIVNNGVYIIMVCILTLSMPLKRKRVLIPQWQTADGGSTQEFMHLRHFTILTRNELAGHILLKYKKTLIKLMDGKLSKLNGEISELPSLQFVLSVSRECSWLTTYPYGAYFGCPVCLEWKKA